MRLAAFLVYLTPFCLSAQDVSVRVRVVHEGLPVPGARVTADTISRTTDATGSALLRLSTGQRLIIATRIGFIPDSARIHLAADTTLTIDIERIAESLEGVVVAATRTERRVEDTPVRVEVIDEEEIAEKVAMTPGDIVMMMNETSGLRVAATSPSLGAANVRIQGLRGRYTLMLMDGLPLAGTQSGFGLLQTPPVDLGRVEVIKGTASSLYGSAALGGVINLVSRRPGDEREREILVNQTSRGGTDAVLYASSPRGVSLLVSAHRQRDTDIDGDQWTDLPDYKRLVVRPRLFLGDEHRSLFATIGATSEDRTGGGLTPVPGPVVPPGIPMHAEGLRTRRVDGGAVGRLTLGEHGIASVRTSATSQRHRHRFGNLLEEDSHLTAFVEASATTSRGPLTIVGGAAYEHNAYENEQVAATNYAFRVPSLFAQMDVDATAWLVLSGAGRVDWHNVYGTSANPRVSALVRLPTRGAFEGWSLRASAGNGTFAPTPLTEETEATGMRALSVASAEQVDRLVRERATSLSLDLAAPVQSPAGKFEINATVFASRIRDAVMTRARDGVNSEGVPQLDILNAPIATRNSGAEALVRWTHDDFRVTASYAHLRATEWDADAGDGARRNVPLAPRHTAGIVASLEREGVSRVGLELYYTGVQTLTDNPYRAESAPYVIVGLLAERQFATRVGRARVFINAENIGNVRQTKYDPLVRPSRGPGGHWTTDAWTELAGFTLNGGVRVAF